jgi:hypothetical protein
VQHQQLHLAQAALLAAVAVLQLHALSQVLHVQRLQP